MASEFYALYNLEGLKVPTPVCKARRQYLPTLQVSRYCLLALYDSTGVITSLEKVTTNQCCKHTTISANRRRWYNDGLLSGQRRINVLFNLLGWCLYLYHTWYWSNTFWELKRMLNPVSPHDALKHHFKSLKTHIIFLKPRVLERKFPWNWFTNTW